VAGLTGPADSTYVEDEVHHLLNTTSNGKGDPMARRSKRKNVLDWWQTVLDETKDLVDDSIDRLRDDDDEDELASEVADLKRSIRDLSAKLDALAAGNKQQPAAKTTP
jgi:hypothetical protein